MLSINKCLLLVLALVFAFMSLASAEAIDFAALTDEELTALHNQVEEELLRRENEARDAIAAQNAQGEIVFEVWENGQKIAHFPSEEYLSAAIRKIPLTLENWSDYLADFYYPCEYVDVNNFGEIERSTQNLHYGFGPREGYLVQFEDAAVKFSGSKKADTHGSWSEDDVYYTIDEVVWKENAEEYTTDLYGEYKEDIHLTDYECLAIVGYIYVLEVTPEITRQALDESNPFVSFYVDGEYIADNRGLRGLYNLYHS